MSKKYAVDILGERYTVQFRSKTKDSKFLNDDCCDGYTDFSTKEIVVRTWEQTIDSLADLRVYEDKVVAHEIVHAFLYESGLDNNSEWARNEEVVDWIALQLDKMKTAVDWVISLRD